MSDPLLDPKSGLLFTKAIIDTIQEPLIILDQKLQVLTASKSFYKKFGLTPEDVQKKMFYDLGNGEWDIPELRKLLERVITKHETIEQYEVIHDFIRLGGHIMLINAREIRYKSGRNKMLLVISDVTEQRRLEEEKEKLSQQKDILLQEMRHRIANSLQLIASILILKAESVASAETRSQLEEVHDRIMSIATVQGHLDPAGKDGQVEVVSYLNALCRSLAKSMIGNRRQISIKVEAEPAKVASDEAISLGLIATELIINSLKHGFDADDTGQILVKYEKNTANWKLTIEDNGVGMSKNEMNNKKGLGTGIIDSISKQLKATVETTSTPSGTIISITSNE